MRTVLILFSVGLLIAFTDAQRKSNFTKPIINLDKRPRPPIWHRPPEERRKLSIFPKNNMKFVVTPKTTVKNDDKIKEGLPTKRPLMKKFVMQDTNDKGTWSFAPREPLMKSKIFTVTLAPPRFSNGKAVDEMKPDESKKVKTVVNNPKPERELSKTHKLNRGNLIEMAQIKRVLPPAASKSLEIVEEKFVKEEISELINVNKTQSFVDIEMNGDKTLPLSDKELEDNVSGERTSNDDDMILNENEIKDKRKKEYKSNDFNQKSLTPDLEVVPKDLIESRVIDFNEIELPIKQFDNSLFMDNKESNNDKINKVLSFNNQDIILEKIVNYTEEFNIDSNSNINDSLSATYNQTKGTIEDLPQFDVSKPNKFYKVISLSNDDDRVNIKEVQKSNDETQNDGDFTENAVDSTIVGNLENLMSFIEEEALDMKTDEIFLGGSQVQNQDEGFIGNGLEIEIDTDQTYTGKPATNISIKSGNIMINDLEEEIQSELSEEFNPVFVDLNSEETLFENKSLSSTEVSNESLVDGDGNVSSNESIIDQFIGTAEENDNKSFIDSYNNLTSEEISNESISDTSNNYTEELSNESVNDKTNNLTGEEISNESLSNMAGEELSNESLDDKSNNLTEEISNESINETSNNFTGEERSDESFEDSDIIIDLRISDEPEASLQNTSGEGISNEALANRFKRSNNIIAEENLATTLSGFKYTVQEKRLTHDLSFKNIHA